MSRQIVMFAVIGAVPTVLHLGGYVVLRQVAPSQVGNGVTLLLAAVANTAANRRWSPGIRGWEGAARHQLQGLVVFALTLVMTSGGLVLLATLAPGNATWVETLVVAVATAVATAVKYVAMRWWVFAPRRCSGWDRAQSSTTANEPSVSSNSTAPVQS